MQNTSNIENLVNSLVLEVKAIKNELQLVKSRNYKKEIDKRFETSYIRTFVLMIITYLTIFGYLNYLRTPEPALNAIVPALGFNISTWSLFIIKKIWIYFMSDSTHQTEAVEVNEILPV